MRPEDWRGVPPKDSENKTNTAQPSSPLSPQVRQPVAQAGFVPVNAPQQAVPVAPAFTPVHPQVPQAASNPNPDHNIHRIQSLGAEQAAASQQFSAPPSQQSPPPPPPPSSFENRLRGAGKPPSSPPDGKKKNGLGWPTAFLILGLAIVGGCCFSFANITNSAFTPMELGATHGSVGVLVMEDEITASVWVTQAIEKFKQDPNIKSLLIRVNSPGGAVAPCQEIYNALKNFKKPIVISMGSVAASGGLYIAAAGDHIMANPGTITGSIGVIMQSVELSGTMEKLGFKSLTIKSGEFKDLGSPFRSMKSNERDILQKMVNEVYEQFVLDMIAGRPNMKPEDLRSLADGRIFTGADAKELGLVDELGGFEDAAKKAAALGGLPAGLRPTMIIEDGKKPFWEAALYGKAQNMGLSLPPALTPGLSMKYIYQPDLETIFADGN